MTDGLKWTVNHVPGSDDKFLDLMSEENITKANEFHKSFPQYSVTPLQKLSALASYLGVKGIYCKDESYRFGLNAFIALSIPLSRAPITASAVYFIALLTATMSAP